MGVLEAYILATVTFVSATLVAEIFIFLYSHFKLRTCGASTNPLRINDRDFNSPSLSIIVPAYREGERLIHALESLSALTYPKDRLQVILALEPDDHETITFLESIGVRCNVSSWISENTWRNMRVTIAFNQSGTKSKPAAINCALKHATGDIVAICDAEDVFEPNIAAIATSILEKDKLVAAVQFARLIHNPHEGGILTKAQQAQLVLSTYYFAPAAAKFTGVPPLLGSVYFVYRHVLEGVGGWDPKAPTEDLELTLKLSKAGYKIVFVEAPLVYTLAVTSVRGLFRQRERWIRGMLLLTGRFLVQLKSTWPLFIIYVLLPVAGLIGWSWLILGLVFGLNPILQLLMIPLFLSVLSYALKVLLSGGEVKTIPILIALEAISELLAVYRLMTSPWKWTKTRCNE
ncbi:MAG: glycosyltransferase family 2 protein [Candidatus Nezhaarchaeota archaeon]|nr:glycosyltransferase family 2 protein [Candidatus Nezhaarchaeota archaeon]